jgi:hypothetical protein
MNREQDEAVKTGEWWSTPNVGIGAAPQDTPIKVDARTGGVSFDPPPGFIGERKFDSLDDLRRITIRIVLPRGTQKSWPEARIRETEEALDASLRECHLGKMSDVAPGEMLFDVFAAKDGIALLKKRSVELGAPGATILEVEDWELVTTLEGIR